MPESMQMIVKWMVGAVLVVLVSGCASSHDLPAPKGAWEPVNCVPAVQGSNQQGES
ncbi:hypothetical protein [Paraburkholderia megapolitana]|uniref:hypothetical protein n=1 Tax=Paraburkholderia megapolitana TaxID=420953 RepID=UPI0038B6D2B6